MAARRLLLPVVLGVLTVVLFDVVAWFVVPTRLTAFAGSYRKVQLVSDAPAGKPAMNRSYPRGYFRADDALGFDILGGARAVHEVDGVPYEVFANRLGCFDLNEPEDLRGSDYYYFAGDSITWGFTPYESKFATLWEAATGGKAAKCGVTHTGQVHQFEKFLRVTAAVGRLPAAVLVGFCTNDPVDDHAHPHSTVVDGFLVDTVFVRGAEVVRVPEADLRREVERAIRELERSQSGWRDRARNAVRVFSLSANIVNAMGRAAWHALQAGAPGGSLEDGRDAIKERYATDP